MKRSIITILLIALLFSCSQIETSNSTIAKKIEKECNGKKPCKINIQAIVNEQWDKMYVFKESASLERINQVIGFNYPYFEDVAKRIIFTRAGKVVFHEDEFPGVESAKNGALVFNIGDTSDYKIFLPSEAIFYVHKVDFSKGSYYELTPSE